MLKNLINKLKLQRNELNDFIDYHDLTEIKPVVDITITSENNIIKMEIGDYISVTDYVERLENNDEYNLLKLVHNTVLWDSSRQCVSKGIYYIIQIDNRLYNIQINDNKIQIDERIRFEETIVEKYLSFNSETYDYRYSSLKHDSTGSTFYTKFYNKSQNESLFGFELPVDIAFEEMTSLFSNLEKINGIDDIIDLDILKKYVLEDTDKKLIK